MFSSRGWRLSSGAVQKSLLGVVVLEIIRLGNAIYVFGNDWETVAQLSKGEIIEGDLHLERIVHRGEWRRKLSRFLARRSAA